MGQERRYVGRTIFHSREEWRVIPLESHVDNVTRLVEEWDTEKAYLGMAGSGASTRDLLIQAARIHDMGKPARFRLKIEKGRSDQAKWSDSYAGHRFAVEHENLYIYLLGQLHHEYSVDGLVEAMTQLRQRGYAEFVPHLPLDLYSLEMADQIEATVARAALGDAQPEARVFMDFAFYADDLRQAVYRLDPYPFRAEPITLNVLYATLEPPQEKIIAVENAAPAEQAAKLRELQTWLDAAFQDAALDAKEITLCPWL
jgi:CRISPR-associated endonuclease/helicase Cas3